MGTNIGWLYFTPIAIALYGAKIPPTLHGTLVAVNGLAVVFASIIRGHLGGFYETMTALRLMQIYNRSGGHRPLAV